MRDLVERQAVQDAYCEHECGKSLNWRNCGAVDCGHIFDNVPSAQPEPQWIPCSEPPKESGTYIVTAYDGIDKRVTFVKYQKTLKRWDLTGARAYWRILAYKPLPEPWKGEET